MIVHIFSLKGEGMSALYTVSVAPSPTHSGLMDNTESEIFPLRHDMGGKQFPSRYIKIVPLQSWGGMLFSIWYLELRGITEETCVMQAQEWLQQVSYGAGRGGGAESCCLQYCRKQALRLCMKHLRECDYTEAYLSLCKHSRVELEHPLLSQLHSDLVIRGDFMAAEAIMQQAAEGVCRGVCMPT